MTKEYGVSLRRIRSPGLRVRRRTGSNLHTPRAAAAATAAARIDFAQSAAAGGADVRYKAPRYTYTPTVGRRWFRVFIVLSHALPT